MRRSYVTVNLTYCLLFKQKDKVIAIRQIYIRLTSSGHYNFPDCRSEQRSRMEVKNEQTAKILFLCDTCIMCDDTNKRYTSVKT